MIPIFQPANYFVSNLLVFVDRTKFPMLIDKRERELKITFLVQFFGQVPLSHFGYQNELFVQDE
jgi:hypothetical protein